MATPHKIVRYAISVYDGRIVFATQEIAENCTRFRVLHPQTVKDLLEGRLTKADIIAFLTRKPLTEAEREIKRDDNVRQTVLAHDQETQTDLDGLYVPIDGERGGAKMEGAFVPEIDPPPPTDDDDGQSEKEKIAQSLGEQVPPSAAGGANTPAERATYQSMGMGELRKIGSGLGVQGVNNMKKEVLIDAICGAKG